MISLEYCFKYPPLHFLISFVIAVLVIVHRLFLHKMGLKRDTDKITFYSYFTIKDIVEFVALFTIVSSLSLKEPYILGEPGNFIPANPPVTRPHPNRNIIPIFIRKPTVNPRQAKRSNLKYRSYSLTSPIFYATYTIFNY
jgi:hypothetical protein